MGAASTTAAVPVLTYRDANAATLMDFVDPSVMAFAEPPDLVAPANPLPGLVQGSQGPPVPAAPARRATTSHPGWSGRIRWVTLVSGKPEAPKRRSGGRGGRNAH